MAQRIPRVQALLDRLDRHARPLAAACLGLGIVLRLIAIAATTSADSAWNLLYPGFGDGQRYGFIARSLVEHHIFGYGGRPTAFRSPAYPALLAATWKLGASGFTAIRVLQCGLFAVTASLYAAAVLRGFGRVPALIVLALLAVHPMLVFMATEIATENLYMPLEAAVFLAMVVVLDHRRPVRGRVLAAFAAGMCCGAGALTRPNMFVVLLVAVAVSILAYWRAPLSRGALAAIVLALVTGNYLVLGPWLLRNAATVGAPVIATNIDYNLFRATFDRPGVLPPGNAGEAVLVSTFRAHGVMYEGEIENPAVTRLPMDEVSNERAARAAAVEIIRADPGLWTRERLRSIAYLWLNLQWESDKLRNPLVFVASVAVSLFYYVLLLAALVSSMRLVRRGGETGKRFLLLAWGFMMAVMPIVLTLVGKRYRVTMIDPLLVVLVGIGAAVWRTAARDRASEGSGSPAMLESINS